MWSTRCSTFTSRRGVDHLSDWAIDLTRARARLEEGQQEIQRGHEDVAADLFAAKSSTSRWSEAQKARAPSACMSFGEVLCVSGCV